MVDLYDKLKDLTNRLNQPKGDWDWDIVSDKLVWSDEIFRIFGLTPKQFGGTYGAFLDSVHCDDREQVKEAVTDALEGKSYSIVHRIVLPDKTMRLVHEEAHVFFNDKGSPVRMVGTVQDITELGQNSEEQWRLYMLDILKEVSDRGHENTVAIARLQVKAGIFSTVGALVAIATMMVIWFMSDRL